ncbi:MAG: DM13 domain-containing protein [Candidatus Kerfeldbacteria bacterium]|nr:DM13 domain-containing protein [Candidatus Kerfeldbacteria bacterium]
MLRPSFVILASLFVLLGAGCQPRSSADVFPQPKVGSVAIFQEHPRWNIRGIVSVVDERTLRFERFSFTGDGLRVDLRLQKNKTLVAILRDITTSVYDNSSFEVKLPDGVTVNDFNLVTVFSPDLGTSVSGAEFSL